MKIITRLVGLLLLIVLAAGAIIRFAPNVLPQPLHVQSQVLIGRVWFARPEWVDWGYLKLRSGKAGLDGLTQLERNGGNLEIQRTSAAVQFQWHAAGLSYSTCIGGCSGFVPTRGFDPEVKETQLSDLNLSADGKTLRQVLPAGQHIPESFWQAQRFHLGCLHQDADHSCTLRMVDLDNDSQPEIVVERVWHGVEEGEVGRTAHLGLSVYKYTDGTWQWTKVPYWFCGVPDKAYKPMIITDRVADELRYDVVTTNLFGSLCYIDNETLTPDTQKSKARAMAGKLSRIEIVKSDRKHMPASLAEALRLGTIEQPDLYLPVSKPSDNSPPDTQPHFSGLPPCFVAADPGSCVAIIADIDHDGSDDVIVIDRAVHHDGKDYRLVTLLMIRDQRWQVAANQALCATRGQPFDPAKVSVVSGKWRPILFGGRLQVPLNTDDCTVHGIMM